MYDTNKRVGSLGRNNITFFVKQFNENESEI